MRLLHTADWHLGRTLHRVPLLDAQRAVLDHLVALAREERVDAILLAGDVFDRALPPVEAVRVAGDALRRLAEVAPVVAISGNHDSAGRLGFAAELIAAGGVHLRTEPLSSGDPVVLRDEHGPVAIYGVPYLDPDLAREPLGVEGRSHEGVLTAAMDLVRADLEGRRGDGPGPAGGGAAPGQGSPGDPGTDAPLRAVVVAHAFVQGGEPSESERDISIGGAQTVPRAVFAGADYVALGHLHRPHAVHGVSEGDGVEPDAEGAGQGEGDDGATAGREVHGHVAPAGSTTPPALAPTPADAMSALAQEELGGLFALPLEDEPARAAVATAEPEPTALPGPVTAPDAARQGGPGAVRYAGSPLPYSFTEADAPKTTAIVDLAADGTTDVRFVAVPSPFRLVRLRGELEALLGDPALAEHESEDSWVEVVLTDAVLPPRPMERLRRRFPRVLVLQHVPEGERGPATVARDRIRGRSDLEILQRFVQDVRGSAPDETETPLLREAAEQVGRDREDEDA